MKKLNILLIFIFVTCFYACQSEDKVTISDTITAPVLEQLLPENIVITETTDMKSKVGKWGWQIADYGYQAAVTYTLQADVHGGKFEKPIEIISSNNNSIVITAAMLNNVAANFTVDSKPLTFDVRLKAVVTSKDGDVTAVPVVYSLPQSITMTPYIAEIPVKSALYIVGDGLVGWTNNPTNIGKDLQVMYAANSLPSEQIYTYTGYFKGGKGIKLITKAGDWDKAHAFAGDGKLTALNGNDNIPTPATDGYYTLTVDISALTYKFDAYVNGATATTYDKVGILGSATSTGWDADTKMTQVLPHIWVLNEINLTGGKDIKFRANDKWDVAAWGKATPSTYFLPFGISTTASDAPNIAVAKSGTYFVSLNDLTKHYIIVKIDKLP